MFLANLRKKAIHFFGLQYLPKSPIVATPPAEVSQSLSTPRGH
jgi:hypothetical protein